VGKFDLSSLPDVLIAVIRNSLATTESTFPAVVAS